MIIQRRELFKRACAVGAMVPFLAPGALLAQSTEDPYLAHVHPELRPFAARMLQVFRNQPPFSRETLAQQRNGMGAFAAKPLQGVPYEKRQVPGGKGQPPVTVYVVNAGKPGQRPAILHTHGGGYIMGTAESGLAGLQALCKELDCVAVTVDYRLAPETTYRGSVEDNYAGLKWLHGNAGALGVDPARIAVMGESAGGGHAALLAIRARDRGEVPLAFQCLIYPMLDDRTGSTRKLPPHVGKLVWTAERNRFGWESFLGTRPGSGSVPMHAVPARVEKLAGLPPGFIGVGTLDLFVDEDIDYAQRLNAAGSATELIVVPGAFHGFDMLAEATVVERFNVAKVEALRRGLGIA
jgi:acetyl esterase/lipase